MIPDGVTDIKTYAFYGCTGLTEVIIPDGVTSIEKRAFYGCSSLNNLSLPGTLTSIGEACFANCTSMENIVIPASVHTLCNEGIWDLGIFKNCKSLSEITIPSSVSNIQSNTFDGCSNVTICGTRNSYAQRYANEKNIAFKAVVIDSVGDTNNDGTIDIRDITAIQRHVSDIQTMRRGRLALADTNGDGNVDINDATHLQTYLAEFKNIALG